MDSQIKWHLGISPYRYPNIPPEVYSVFLSWYVFWGRVIDSPSVSVATWMPIPNTQWGWCIYLCNENPLTIMEIQGYPPWWWLIIFSKALLGDGG